jgi:hypothetical protein
MMLLVYMCRRHVTGLIHGAAAGADASCIYLESFSFSLLCTIEYTHTVLPNFHIVTDENMASKRCPIKNILSAGDAIPRSSAGTVIGSWHPRNEKYGGGTLKSVYLCLVPRLVAERACERGSGGWARDKVYLVIRTLENIMAF